MTALAQIFQINNGDPQQVALTSKASAAGLRDPLTQAEEPAYGRVMGEITKMRLRYDLVKATDYIDKFLRPSANPYVYEKFQHRGKLADPEIVASLSEKLFVHGEQQKNAMFWIEYENAQGEDEIICPFGIRRSEATCSAAAAGLDISKIRVILVYQNANGSKLTEQEALKLSILLSVMSNAGAEGVADPTSQSEKGRGLAQIMGIEGWTYPQNKEEISQFAMATWPDHCGGEDSRSKQALTNIIKYATGDRQGIVVREDINGEYVKEVYEKAFTNEEWNPEENNGSNGIYQFALEHFSIQQLWLKMLPESVWGHGPNDVHLVIADHNKQTEESLQKFYEDVPKQLEKWNEIFSGAFKHSPLIMTAVAIARTSLPNDVDKAWTYSKTRREWAEVK
jgi:hypothetical protein